MPAKMHQPSRAWPAPTEPFDVHRELLAAPKIDVHFSISVDLPHPGEPVKRMFLGGILSVMVFGFVGEGLGCKRQGLEAGASGNRVPKLELGNQNQGQIVNGELPIAN